MSRLAFPVSPRRVRTALSWSMKDLRILKGWSLPTYHACKPYANSEGVYPFVLARPVPGDSCTAIIENTERVAINMKVGSCGGLIA